MVSSLIKLVQSLPVSKESIIILKYLLGKSPIKHSASSSLQVINTLKIQYNIKPVSTKPSWLFK